MTPSYVWQSLWDPLDWEPSPTLATSLGSLLGRLTMPPTSWDHPGMAWVSQTTEAHHHYQATLPQTGRSGSRMGGFPRSSSVVQDNSTMLLELPDTELSSPSKGWVRFTVSVVPLESLDG